MKTTTFDELEQLARRLRKPVALIPMPAGLYTASVEYTTDDPAETWLIDLTGHLERRIDRVGKVRRTKFRARPQDVSCHFVDYVLDALDAGTDAADLPQGAYLLETESEATTMSIVKMIRRFRDPDRWLGRLASQGGTLDAQFTRALRRGAHLPTVRRSWLPWRRLAQEEILVVERPASTLPAPAAAGDRAVNALLGDARERARAEVARHVAGLPRGRERAAKWAPLVVAHELRTTRVLETEMRRERRVAGQPVPDVDYRARLVGEMRALEAEIGSERRAETFDPLAEQELAVRQGQLVLVRLLLDMDNARADLQARRAARPAGSVSGSDDGGNLHAQPRQRGIDLGMEL